LCKHLTAPLRYSRWTTKPFFIGSKSIENEISEKKDSDLQYLQKSDKKVDDDDDDVDDDENLDDESFLPLFLQSPFRVATSELFESAEDVLANVIAGNFTLRRCEGVRMAYTNQAIYVDGEVTVVRFNSLTC